MPIFRDLGSKGKIFLGSQGNYCQGSGEIDALFSGIKGAQTPLGGLGGEALGWKDGFRAFHRAIMSSQDTQVNTVGCIMLPKAKLNTLRPYNCAEFHAHAYLPYT